MRIFPIGTILENSSSGSIDDVSYSMFEPNKGCRSTPMHNVLVDRFEQQTLHTRKKSEPFLTFVYTYDHIFDREYRQIEHFIENVDEALTSFYLVDFSKGQTPSSISPSNGNWIVSLSNTRLYSDIVNKKANRAFVWDGTNWKEGQITSLVDNTSITIDVDTNNYGDLSLSDAQSNGIVYPLYQVYLGQGILSNFQEEVYVDENINLSYDGGWMRSGNITFTSKYPV